MIDNPYASGQAFWNSLQLADQDRIGASAKVTFEKFAQQGSLLSMSWSNATDADDGDVSVLMQDLKHEDAIRPMDHNHMVEKGPLEVAY